MTSEHMRLGSVEIDLFSIPGVTGAGPAAVDTVRMIEVPLGAWFLQKYPDAIEVGAVMPYYLPSLGLSVNHTIIDPGDSYPGCVKQLAENVDYRDKIVLSISTIEHTGTVEYGGQVDEQIPVTILHNMMTATKYFVTWSPGQCGSLDRLIESNTIRCLKFRRTQWRVWTPVDNLCGVPHGDSEGDMEHGIFPWGNGVYIVTNCEELYG